MKSDFIIDPIGKKDAEGLLLKYHYLKDHSKGFKSGYNYGLFRDEPISSEGTLGVCIFTGLPVPELAQSAFGLQRDQQDGLFELSRLCLHPSIQRSEKNMATWFVSRCLRRLRQRTMVRAVLSYADADYHAGVGLGTTARAPARRRRTSRLDAAPRPSRRPGEEFRGVRGRHRENSPRPAPV